MYKHETKKPWKCDQCEYAHALQKGLQEHVRNCHPKESDLKVCHICGYKTTLNHNLKEHIERTHEKKRRFTCNLWWVCWTFESLIFVYFLEKFCWNIFGSEEWECTPSRNWERKWERTLFIAKEWERSETPKIWERLTLCNIYLTII